MVATLDPVAFRRLLGQFPTGVTIVTADAGGRAVGMTANSFASVSLDPPLVLWSVSRAAPSYPVFAGCQAFAIHFLGADQADLAHRFAGRAADTAGGKFGGLSCRAGVTGAPVLAGLAPVIECHLWARHPAGDHDILVGQVAHFEGRCQAPLLFHQGSIRGLDVIEPL